MKDGSLINKKVPSHIVSATVIMSRGTMGEEILYQIIQENSDGEEYPHRVVYRSFDLAQHEMLKMAEEILSEETGNYDGGLRLGELSDAGWGVYGYELLNTEGWCVAGSVWLIELKVVG